MLRAQDYIGNTIKALEEADHKRYIVAIRGPSGAGKTTVASEVRFHSDKAYPVASDDFFTRFNIATQLYEYRFDIKLLPTAHAFCDAMTQKLLHDEKAVIVHNTFTQDWELEKVRKSAVHFQCPLLLVRLKTQFQNTHGVPEDKVKAMQERMVANDKLTIPEGFVVVRSDDFDTFEALLLAPKQVEYAFTS